MRQLQAMFQQWAHGQDPFDIVTRIEVFIELASKNIGAPQQSIKNYLETQDWYKKSLDNK